MTDTFPLVSVIIPCYNCSKTIVATLESIRKQVYKNYEIICINDGSTDRTYNTIYEWSCKNKIPVKIINQKNRGVSSARNNGIRNASGMYVCFIDADDEYASSFIKSLVLGIVKNKCDASYCKITRVKKRLDAFSANKIQKQTTKQTMRNLLYNMGEIGFSCFLYNRDMLINSNLLFDEDIRYGEDRSFVWKYICKQKRIAYIDLNLYWYRKNSMSATRKRKQNWNRTDSLIAVDRTTSFLSKNGCGFVNEYNRYMYSRDMWAVCKAFAISGEATMYRRLLTTYNVEKCMRITLRDHSTLVRVASRFFVINPMLFYYMIRAAGRFIN